MTYLQLRKKLSLHHLESLYTPAYIEVMESELFTFASDEIFSKITTHRRDMIKRGEDIDEKVGWI